MAGEWDLVARNIGVRVRDLRHLRGLSQQELCVRIAKLGPAYPELMRANLSHIERGSVDRGVPSLRTLVTVARGLGVPLGTLLVGVDDHLRGK